MQVGVDTYASEINKLASVWRAFDDGALGYRPHPKSMTVGEVLQHELLSARRFFGEFLGLPEPPAAEVLPSPLTVEGCVARLASAARTRVVRLAGQPRSWWDERVRFFDVDRTREWIFWRRVLHTAHHRTQLTVYLRLLGRAVPSTYGPTADVTWAGADPTRTADAAER
jgi:uncharacterized damage-inducible protein DinB